MKYFHDVLTSLYAAIMRSFSCAFLSLLLLVFSYNVQAQEIISEQPVKQISQKKAEEVEQVTIKPTVKNPLIVAKGKLYNGYARITLRTSDITNFRVNKFGNQLSIVFNKPVDVDFTNIEKNLSGYIEKSSLSLNKKMILFQLKNPENGIRKFLGDGVIGVDLIEKPHISAGVIENENKKYSVGRPISILPEQRLRAINRFAKVAEPKKIKPTLKPEIKIAAPKPIEKPAVPEKPIEAVKLIDKEPTPEQAKIPEKTTDKERAAAKESQNIEVAYEKIKDGSKIIFPWQSEVAAAMFARGNSIWLVFDVPSEIKLKKATSSKFVEEANQISHKTHSTIQIKISDEFQVQRTLATKESFAIFRGYKEGTRWVLEIEHGDLGDEASDIAANSISVSSKKENNSPIVVLSIENPAKPLEMLDTEVGDTLIVVPIASGETGIDRTRRYVDFWLPNTAQGVVIQKLSDSLQYKTGEKFVEISSEDSLNISPDLIREEEQQEIERAAKKTTKRVRKVVLPSDTVFPFEFKMKENKENDENKNAENFSQKKQKLLAEILTLPEDKKTPQRMKLGKFYFSHGLYSEAMGPLVEIKQEDPDYEDMQEVDIIIAASEYMLARYKDAEKIFDKVMDELSEDHENYDEIKMWQWASHFLGNRSERKKNREAIPVDYIASYDKFMQHYPADIRYDFGLLAVENHLDEDNTKTANTILEIISYKGIPEKLKNSTIYLQGKSKEVDGDIDGALEIWRGLLETVDDRFNRARALYDSTRLKLLHGRIGIKEALESFEKVGAIWRGDSYELDLLKITGQLYIKNEQYSKGLKKWQTLVMNFPNTKEALFIAGRMKKTFVKLFDEGEAYNLPPLNALSLYFEFRELTPIGKRGDRIIKQLVDHFIKADLLDSASTLLTHQVNFRSTGEEQNQLTLKLMDLHMKNQKPEMAISALELMDTEAATKEIKDKSRHLHAKALIRLNRFDDALELLKNDFSKEAESLRLDIFWKEKNWFGIIRLAEPRAIEMKTQRTPIEPEQQQTLIRLSVAYASQEYREKLRDMRVVFYDKIRNPQTKKVFDFITNDIPTLNPKEFEETVQLIEIEGFLDEYAFWPAKDWKNVAVVLSPKIERLRKKKDLTQKDKNDVLRLAIAYVMYGETLEDEKAKAEVAKKLSGLQRNFRGVTIDRNSIGIFEILDDKFVKKEKDVVFEGKVSIGQIASFIEKYRIAQSMSELNVIIQ